MTLTTELNRILPSVLKPSRYINREINCYYKKPSADKVNFCFAYPDIYEVGFSHLGLKILYNIINETSDATAERAYAPWTDFANRLKKAEIPLFSIENQVTLKEFDIIGFTLQSELTYTNILYMLDLSGIALKSSERKENDPIVIAGGPGSGNPEPLADFIDAFFIGEAEEGIIEIKNVFMYGKKLKLSRKEILSSIRDISGVYVPAQTETAAASQVTKIRKFVDFGSSDNYKNQLIPWHQVTHERYVFELFRGCTRNCRFCYAGSYYRPVRERKLQDIVRQLTAEVEQQGWEEAALLSLSSGDYSCISSLLWELSAQLHETELSLPSMRVDSLNDNIIRLLNRMGQYAVTIAPEAGSQRLRDIINKDITEDQILKLVKIAAENNWRLIKLYFMVGLPFETDEDIEEIVELVKLISETGGKRMKINITLSPFVPQPHTPFQWAAMASQEVLLDRIYRVKNALGKHKWIKVKYHSLDNSLLECLMSRGDRKVGSIILNAYKNGAVFDGWDECFDFSHWLKAIEDSGLNIADYTGEFDTNDSLIWDHIDLGMDKKYLRSEFRKASSGELTQDCRTAPCSNCGVCDGDIKPDYEKSASFESSVDEIDFVDSQLDNISPKPQNVQNSPGYTYRIYYSKTGMLKYVSHLEMLRMIHRFLRMTNLPIVYTQGFNRHPKIHFCPPLAVGVEGEKEFFDFKLTFPYQVNDVMTPFTKIRVKDFRFLNIVQPDMEKLPGPDKYHYEVVSVSPLNSIKDQVQQSLNVFNDGTSCVFTKIKKGKEKEIELKDIIVDMTTGKDKLVIIKKVAGASVFNVLETVFGIPREDTGCFTISREYLLVDEVKVD
jgi:radical SAM family uncharacterized protein/radical SAM-linked protein